MLLILSLVFGWHVTAVLVVLVDGLRRVLAVHAVQAGERGLLV